MSDTPLQPTDLGAAMDLVRALEAGGRLGDAMAALDRAIELEPREAELFMWKAQLAAKLARPLDAEDALLKALALNPGHVAANFHLAQVYYDLCIWDRCVRQWERSIELSPNEVQPYFEAGRVFGMHLEQYDRAFRLFDALPNVIDGFWLSEIANVQRLRRDARARVRNAIKARKAGRPLDVTTVRDLLHLGKVRTARGLLDKIGEAIDPILRQMAQFEINWRADELEHALESLDVAGDVANATQPMRFLIADGLYQLGAFEASAELWRDGDFGELAPHVQELYFRATFATRDYGRAIAIARQMMEQRPYDTKAAQLVLTALLSQGAAEPVNTPGTGELTIPPVLFRFWDKPTPPADVQEVLDSWNDPAEGLRQVLFDEAAARAFIAQAYPEPYLAAFNACHHPAMKSDFLRLCYLTEMGGVYLDVDQARVPGGPSLRDALVGRSLILPLSGTSPFYTNNNIIACVPGHPVLRRALAEALHLVETATRDGQRPDIWVTTGPGAFTRSLVRYLLNRMEHGGAADPEGGEIALLSARYLESMTALVNDLSYKGSAAGNWRMI